VNTSQRHWKSSMLPNKSRVRTQESKASQPENVCEGAHRFAALGYKGKLVVQLFLFAALTVPTPVQGQAVGKGQSPKTTAPKSADSEGQRPLPAVEPSDYVIGPEDVLDISVWKEPDFSRLVPVRPDGKISLPLLKDIQAAGLTPTQLAAAITVTLRKYVTQPQVTVIVTAINSQRVYVLGEVARPGPVPLLPDMTILQALSTAGGLSQFASRKGIYVLRSENGKQVTYPFNYKAAVQGKAAAQNITLKPGDTIVVP